MNKLIKLSAMAAGCVLFATLSASTVYAVTDLSDYLYDYDYEISRSGYSYSLNDYALIDDLSEDEDLSLNDMEVSDYSLDDFGSSGSGEILDLDDPYYQPVQPTDPQSSNNGSSPVIYDLDDIGTEAPEIVTTEEPAADPAAGSSSKVTSDMSRALGTINSMRAKSGAGALKFSDALNRVAALRAAEATRNFSHTRPNGKAGVSILAENGISYGMAGENIACAGSSAESAVSAWAASSSHSRCMLNSGYRQAGLGCATVGGATVWVLILTD